MRGFPNPHIWVFNANGQGRRVSSFAGAEEDPVWSPDGRSLYYSALLNDSQRIMRRPLDAEGEETICTLDGAEQFRLQDITPDGRHLLGARIRASVTSVEALETARAPSAKPEVVLTPPAGRRVLWARIAPDGKSLLFNTDGDTEGANMYGTAYPAPTGPPRPLATFLPRAAISGSFSRDGRTLLLVSATPGAPGISLLPLRSNGGAIEAGQRIPLFRVVTTTRAGSNTAALSPDGSRILVISTDSEDDFRTQVLSDWTTLIKP
jgi:Tol biopolymer transport system component